MLEKQDTANASHVTIAECLQKKFYDLEAERVEKEDGEKERAEEYDKVEKVMEHTPVNVSALQKSRKFFEEYREAECLRQRYLYGTGSLAGHGQLACKIRITQQRIDELTP